MPDTFIFLMLIFTGAFSFISLIILMGCSSMLKDLSFRIRRLEKHLNVDGLAKQPAPPPKQPDVRIHVPGATETKTVPGFLLSNQTASNPPQNQPEIKPEVKPEAAAVKPEVKPEVKPMPVHTEPPAQAASPVKPEPPKPAKPEIKPVVTAANTSETFDTKSQLNVPRGSNAWMEKSVEAPQSGPDDIRPYLKRSAIEERTAEVLSKMWQWLIVGEEYRKGGVSKEYAVATTWMLRAAVLLIVLGLAYFIKYTHDRNLLPPELRLSVAALFTMALLGLGCRLLKGAKYRIFGTALAGAGFTGLYLCVFAGVSVYHLLSAWVGLAGLVVVTAAGVALALRYNSILLAVLAVCGGYLAPVLMDTGSRNLAGLYGYMLILVVGSLAIARMRSWQPVNILSFLFTWGIYAASKPFPGHGTYSMPYIKANGWLEHADLINQGYTVALAAGALFFLAFCVQTVVYNLYAKRKASLLELGFAALNGIIFMSLAIPPTIRIYGREYAAAVTFGGALVYLIQIALLIRMKLEDRNLLLTLLVFACGLISLTFPLLLNQDHLAVAWSAQAAAMLYIACRTRSVILLRLSYIVYLIAAVRLLGFDFARGYARPMQGFWTRIMNFGSYTAALAGAFFMLKRYAAGLDGGNASAGGSASNYPRSSKIMFWGAYAVSFLMIVGEFSYLKNDCLGAGCVVATGALYLMFLSLIPRLFRENAGGIVITGVVLLCLYLMVMLILLYESGAASYRDSLWRFFPNLLSVVLLGLAGRFFGQLPDAPDVAESAGQKARGVGVIFLVSAVAFWFLYSTDEVWFLVGHYGSRGGALIAVSLLWGVYALILLAVGILRKKRVVRIPALVLFAVTVLKIFLLDLDGTPALYRIAGCMVTGAVLIAGAWLYARFAQKGDPSDETRP